MLTKLPSASEQEVENAATQIAKALRSNFRWHENFTAMSKVPQVGTNIGTFIAYGVKQPKEVGRVGDVAITEAKPHSMHLLAVTKVPTSQQKVLLLEAIALKVARKLGAPAETIVERGDPVKHERLVVGLAQLEGEERTEETDPYKTIVEPFSITMRWPAPAEGS